MSKHSPGPNRQTDGTRRSPRQEADRAGSAKPSRRDPPIRAGATRMFATAIPGLAPIIGRELAARAGIAIEDIGFDGRSDVILFEAARGNRPEMRDLGLIEDLFVEFGRTQRAEGDRASAIAGRIWRPEQVQRALSVWADVVRPLRGAMTVRVIVRVLQEQSFLRTELRRQLGEVISRDRPRWRSGDPAQLEVWVTEYAPGRFTAGLRLSDATMRQHDGRNVEREGALRPTVAGAMVRLAGEPRGLLLDPCCGSGTILREAIALGWRASGRDIDPDAVATARRNVPGTEIHAGDARRLDLADASTDACVSNLPFGRQFAVQGEMDAWLRAVLGETARVTRPGGRVVLLAPNLPRALVPAQLRLRERVPIRLLGTKTTIWTYDRIG